MTILFISDLHLTPQRPVTATLFSEFMRGRAREADSLYILGDLFEYWIGLDAVEVLQLSPLLEEISALVRAGTDVYFIAGNRDFLVRSDQAKDTGLRVLPDGTILELEGRPVLLMHGDSLCTDDTSHQAFRKLVLDPTWQDGFLARPIEDRIELARKARMISAESTSEKSMDIMDVNTDAVRDAMLSHDVGLLIHGHTHRPDIHSVELNNAPGYRIVLGDWHEEASFLEYSDGMFELTAGGNTQTLEM